MQTLESLYNSLGDDDRAEWNAYDPARYNKVAEIAEYIADFLKPGLDARRMAESLMYAAESRGAIRGNVVTVELASRYTLSGHPLVMTV